MKKTTTTIYDILGISSAGICLIHCLVFPLLTILPLGWIHNAYIDLLFATIGLFAVIKITKDSNLLVITILIISIALIWISVLSELFLDLHSDAIFIGGIGMIIGHFLNYKNHKPSQQ
jgi:hypothetical protein